MTTTVLMANSIPEVSKHDVLHLDRVKHMLFFLRCFVIYHLSICQYYVYEIYFKLHIKILWLINSVNIYILGFVSSYFYHICENEIFLKDKFFSVKII